MQSFGKGNIKKIKELVYNSWAHDALLESFTYNGNGETAKIEFFNPIYKIKTTMVFSDIEVVLMTKGDWGGERETIRNPADAEPAYRERNGQAAIRPIM